MNRFEVGIRDHRAAAEAYLSRARELSTEQWDKPIGENKWSPAQISEHLRLAYTVVGTEIVTGTGGLRPRVPFLIRPLVRFKFLRGILRDGKLPPGARASHEITPAAGPFPQVETLDALEKAVSEFEAVATGKGSESGLAFTHHVFGTLRGSKALRFVTVHFQHHTRQLPEANRAE